jgi:asparagine synthetase B (glutamine-hydrolysing)
LERLHHPFNSYSIRGQEFKDILDKRIKISGKKAMGFDMLPSHDKTAKDYLIHHCEPFNYKAHSKETSKNKWLSDNACIGLSQIASMGKRDGCKIYLSGQGADEIISNYEMTGWYPKDLTKVYPWRHFFGGKNIDYLKKEDYIVGSYGLEGRYPFLDKDVVQEYLSITHHMKNAHYKAPIRHLFIRFSYPFKDNAKVGFKIHTQKKGEKTAQNVWDAKSKSKTKSKQKSSKHPNKSIFSK